jgi:hypothetical protein
MKLYALFHHSGLCLELHEVEDHINLLAPYVLQTEEAYATWKAKQAVPPPEPEPEPSNDVPDVVSPWQMRRALNQLGLRAAIEAALASADQDTKDGWAVASEFRRDHDFINRMAAGLGMTSPQLDDLFRLAAAFK